MDSKGDNKNIQNIDDIRNIIIVVGPIGYGKSKFSNYLQSLNTNYQHIDGDELDIGMTFVMKLGPHRNSYTVFQIVKSLMRGKTPIISTGGGVLVDFFDKSTNFRKYIEDLFNCKLNIILFVPSEDNKIVDKKYNPIEYYRDSHLVFSVLDYRLSNKIWVKPIFKTSYDFECEILKKSTANYKFCMDLIEMSDQIYGFPDHTKLYDLELTLKFNTATFIPKFKTTGFLINFNNFTYFIEYKYENDLFGLNILFSNGKNGIEMYDKDKDVIVKDTYNNKILYTFDKYTKYERYDKLFGLIGM